LGGFDNEIKLKTNSYKYPISGGKRVVRRDENNVEKWQMEAGMYTTASSAVRPIIATSTRSKV
jgi:hypothetical protein